MAPDPLARSSHHVSKTRMDISSSPTRPRVVRRIASCRPAKNAPPSASRRRVTFIPEMVSETRFVERRCDITSAESGAFWYCKSEFHGMKKMMLPTLKKMARKLPLDQDEEPRGLEHQTPQGSKRRHQNRYFSVDAVMQEQDRQWERNRPDPGFLAKMYRQSSAHCSLQSSLIAKEDEDFVNQKVRGCDEANPAEESSYGEATEEISASLIATLEPSSVIHDMQSSRILSAAA